MADPLDPFDIVSQIESSNQNIPQKIHDINTDRGTPAGGYFQIIDPTWRTYAPRAGVDLKQFPTAMSGNRDVQQRVAAQIPINQWGNASQAALKAAYPGLNTSQTLGSLSNPSISGSSGIVDPTIAAGGPGATPAPAAAPTTVADALAALTKAGAGGKSPLQNALGDAQKANQTPQPQKIDTAQLLQQQQAAAQMGIAQQQQVRAQAQQMAAALQARAAQPFSWGSSPPGEMFGAGSGQQAPGMTLNSLGGLYG